MFDATKDRGVICAVLEHFATHMAPRTRELESKLDAGLPLNDEDIDHLARVLAQIRQVKPLVDRHPEYSDLAAGVISLYAVIVRRAWQDDPRTRISH